GGLFWGQSAQADFANFQRRIHSLRLGVGRNRAVTNPALVHRDGVRHEPSAKADITFSVPRIHSPGLGADHPRRPMHYVNAHSQ
ncbi:hypothetical protein, partial [Longimicrobium sp.]|uniref:hypothetical protein n=1 Tax=Longimicrobium sp. TaxID=2029185 RepID=UPI002E3747F9